VNKRIGRLSPSVPGGLAIVGAAMLWGTVTVSTQALYQIDDTNASSIGFWRIALAVPALMVMAWRALGWRAFRAARRDLALMGVIGASLAAYQVTLFSAIPRLGVTVAVIITICSAPVMVAILATMFLGERLTARVMAALLAALSGTMLLSGLTNPSVETGRADGVGVTLALAAALSYSLVALCSRALARRYHPLQPISLGFAAGVALLLPFALANGLVVSYSLPGWGILLYLGLLPTALAYWLYLQGLQRTSATSASIIALLEPLTATILAAVLFGERLAPAGWLGAALLLGAMGLLLIGRPAFSPDT
jgi:DME family drug/metabolite transporter